MGFRLLHISKEWTGGSYNVLVVFGHVQKHLAMIPGIVRYRMVAC